MPEGNGHEPSFEELIENQEECENCEVQVTNCCQSCGMPMNSAADYGGGNTENNCCVHCCHTDGSLKSYDDIHAGMVVLFMQTRSLDKESAERAAKDYMATMPAWVGK
jgi:hypothetical protein